MKLPHAHTAIIEREKIVGYLLNQQHDYGASKAEFFLSYGFTPEKWELFEHALRKHIREHEVSKIEASAYGFRYQIDGELSALDGRAPPIRTIWQWDKGRLAPRLITAYPL